MPVLPGLHPLRRALATRGTPLPPSRALPPTHPISCHPTHCLAQSPGGTTDSEQPGLPAHIPLAFRSGAHSRHHRGQSGAWLPATRALSLHLKLPHPPAWLQTGAQVRTGCDGQGYHANPSLTLPGPGFPPSCRSPPGSQTLTMASPGSTSQQAEGAATGFRKIRGIITETNMTKKLLEWRATGRA